MNEAQFYLGEFLKAHGVPVEEDGDWLQCGPVRATAAIVDEAQHAQALVAQLDVLVDAGAEQPIVESFAGVGAERMKAIGDAFHNFSVNSLHVLLEAFWGVQTEQVAVEDWEIDGVAWRAFLGNYGVRTALEEQVWPPEDALDRMREAIEREGLRGHINWFRWFYCDTTNGQPTCEALKNNEVWESGIEAMQSLAWPAVGAFWSVRAFMILRRA